MLPGIALHNPWGHAAYALVHVCICADRCAEAVACIFLLASVDVLWSQEQLFTTAAHNAMCLTQLTVGWWPFTRNMDVTV
jgi:hypothetical protein